MKLTHSKLCELAVKWLRKVKKQNCLYHTYPITGSEIACYNGVKWIETPDAIGFNAYSSCVIECKTSRSDFFADQKKPFRTDGNGMGQMAGEIALYAEQDFTALTITFFAANIALNFRRKMKCLQ